MTRADDIANAKAIVPATSIGTEDFQCPIGKRYTHCVECDHTDKVGLCYWPVDIQTEIKEGRARPHIHNYSWPEREADFARRLRAHP